MLFDCRITRFTKLFTARYSEVFYPCTINFDVPSQILQANNFGAPLSPFAPIFKGGGAMAPLAPLPPRHCSQEPGLNFEGHTSP